MSFFEHVCQGCTTRLLLIVCLLVSVHHGCCQGMVEGGNVFVKGIELPAGFGGSLGDGFGGNLGFGMSRNHCCGLLIAPSRTAPSRPVPFPISIELHDVVSERLFLCKSNGVCGVEVVFSQETGYVKERRLLEVEGRRKKVE